MQSSEGTSALARSCAARHREHVSLQTQNDRKCSAVMPDGPPATPRFALLTFRANSSEASANNRQGWDLAKQVVASTSLAELST